MEKSEFIIRRPKREETETIYEFFKTVLSYAYEINGIDDAKGMLEEWNDKKRILNQDFDTAGRDRFFLFAEYEGRIIGCVESGIANDLMKRCTNNAFEGLPEIGTVYTHPGYHRQGVASQLLYHLFRELEAQGIDEFCLDSGFKEAQKIWRKKYGPPEYFLKDFWGEGSSHMVWRVKVEKALGLFKPAE